jgi:ribonuclease HII
MRTPDLSLETKFDGPVCGLDEVGRGPLAGPVMAACVYIPPHVAPLPFTAHIHDSKKLSAQKRAELAPLIRAHCIWGLGSASVDEIDQINILQATFLAMQRAFDGMIRSADEQMGLKIIHALVDGNRAPKLPVPLTCVIKGDQTSLSIAAASIIAKVARDELMADLAVTYPEYGWADNAGYGTAAHLAALITHGLTPHHRRTFAPVRTHINERVRVVEQVPL